MATLAPTVKFREKNPNVILLELLRDEIPLVPSTDLALFLELRTDPTGQILTNLAISQPDPDSGILASEQLPVLKPGTYYIDLRQEPTNGIPFRSGLAMLQILPVGSLEKLSDVQGLTVTIDERSQIISAQLDATPSATLAAYYANLAQSLIGNVLAFIREDETSVTLGVGGSIQYTDHSEDHYPSVTLTFL